MKKSKAAGAGGVPCALRARLTLPTSPRALTPQWEHQREPRAASASAARNPRVKGDAAR